MKIYSRFGRENSKCLITKEPFDAFSRIQTAFVQLSQQRSFKKCKIWKYTYGMAWKFLAWLKIDIVRTLFSKFKRHMFRFENLYFIVSRLGSKKSVIISNNIQHTYFTVELSVISKTFFILCSTFIGKAYLF